MSRFVREMSARSALLARVPRRVTRRRYRVTHTADRVTIKDRVNGTNRYVAIPALDLRDRWLTIDALVGQSLRRPSVAGVIGGADVPTRCVTHVATQDTGAPGGTRTHGLLLRRQTLYPLSYGRATASRVRANARNREDRTRAAASRARAAQGRRDTCTRMYLLRWATQSTHRCPNAVRNLLGQRRLAEPRHG